MSEQTMREEFEAWATSRFKDTAPAINYRDGLGGYSWSILRCAWEAWQAALSQREAVEPLKIPVEMRDGDAAREVASELLEALSQREIQEPVAWYDPETREAFTLDIHSAIKTEVGERIIPLYTAAPSREVPELAGEEAASALESERPIASVTIKKGELAVGDLLRFPNDMSVIKKVADRLKRGNK